MGDVLRPEVAERGGYEPDDRPAELVMDANESPYDLPREVKRKTYRRLEGTAYHRYPDPGSRPLVDRAADYFGVPPDRIVAGNGSDELITYLLTACVNPGERVVVPEPTFSMYGILARQLHAEVVSVPLGSEWSLTEEILSAARDGKVVFLGYPNNPTGNCFDEVLIERLLAESDALVVVDEAYFEFSGRTWMDRVTSHEHLVVLRTMSKAFGLAGIRVGFLVSSETVVKGVRTVKLPYNLNRLSRVTAEEALEARDGILERVAIIKEERRRLTAFLREQGLSPFSSEANFVLFEPPDPQALHEHLLQSGIRVRSFSEPELVDYLRVTVGTPEENERFRDAVERF